MHINVYIIHIFTFFSSQGEGKWDKGINGYALEENRKEMRLGGQK